MTKQFLSGLWLGFRIGLAVFGPALFGVLLGFGLLWVVVK